MKDLCLKCDTALALRDAPEKLRKLFREVWISPLIMGLGAFVGLAALLATERPAMGLTLAAVVSAPFLIVAIVIAGTRSIGAAWVGFGLEVLFFLSLLGSGSLLFALVAALLPIMTVAQILKILKLRALLKTQPISPPRPV